MLCIFNAPCVAVFVYLVPSSFSVLFGQHFRSTLCCLVQQCMLTLCCCMLQLIGDWLTHCPPCCHAQQHFMLHLMTRAAVRTYPVLRRASKLPYHFYSGLC
eukprot:292480-Pelagomonas_calceolata.AAC.2